MDYKKNELIKELENVSALFKTAQLIQNKMDCYTPIDNYERKVKVPKFPCEKVFSIEHEKENALDLASNEYNKAFKPVKPKEKKRQYDEPKYTPEEKKKEEKYGARSFIGIGVGIFFALGIFSALTDPVVLIVIILISLAGFGLFLYSKFQLKKLAEVLEKRKQEALLEFEEKQKQDKKEFEQSLKDYEKALEDHKAKLNKFLNEYTAWREIYLKHLAEENEIAEKLENDRLAGIEKINNEEFVPIVNKLSEVNDLVSNEYLPVVDSLINILSSGRADDIKEAINVYVDDVYRERQLQLQREQEAQRRYDEERRNQKEDKFRREQINEIRRSNCVNYGKYYFSCKSGDCSDCSSYQPR